MPSSTFLHFLLDFAIAFFAILAVLFVGSIQTWSLLGALAMISSAIRCALSWCSNHKANNELKKTLIGSIGVLIIMGIIYAVAPVVNQLMLSAVVFVIVLIFVAYSSRKK
ncbi:MAG: hypothetical protein AABX14_02810 [Candidatus Aenigmatarchaeota archaeon]